MPGGGGGEGGTGRGEGVQRGAERGGGKAQPLAGGGGGGWGARSTPFIILIDFSSFDKIVVHLKLQTCFVLPGYKFPVLPFLYKLPFIIFQIYLKKKLETSIAE